MGERGRRESEVREYEARERRKGDRKSGKSQMGEQNPIKFFLPFIYSKHIYYLFGARSHVSSEHKVVVM